MVLVVVSVVTAALVGMNITSQVDHATVDGSSTSSLSTGRACIRGGYLVDFGVSV